MLGLGNPGAEYEHTRHNAGADAVVLLAARHGLVLRAERRAHALAAESVVRGRRLVVAVPTTYMNDSGLAASACVRRFSVADPGRLVVVHDELDLPVGTVRVKRGGGTAGHNGLKSLQSHLHSTEFVRVRIGIGRPPGRMSGADYVLRRPSRADGEALAVACELAADSVEMVLDEGPEAAMNAVNGR
ncbi:MAG: aminoacyl-tRNA hydrolase [Actinomycetota bacterium]|nr:aminoacyl-tRNA hydrolase [Actinomycetota bacterium]